MNATEQNVQVREDGSLDWTHEWTADGFAWQKRIKFRADGITCSLRRWSVDPMILSDEYLRVEDFHHGEYACAMRWLNDHVADLMFSVTT